MISTTSSELNWMNQFQQDAKQCVAQKVLFSKASSFSYRFSKEGMYSIQPNVEGLFLVRDEIEWFVVLWLLWL